MKIYLASPYTHEDPNIMELRYEAAVEKAGELMEEGHIVYSPIAHCHPIAIKHGLPRDFTYWKKHARSFLLWADVLCTLRISGWLTSTGINEEVLIAIKLNKDRYYTYPQGGMMYKSLGAS